MKAIYYIFFIFLLIIITDTSIPSAPFKYEKSLNIIISGNNKYISISNFKNLVDINNSYDIISGRGKLYYKGAIAVYQVGFSVILLNGKIIKSDYPVTKLRCDILIPVKFITNILEDFYPDHIFIEKNEQLYISKKQELVNNEIKREQKPSSFENSDRISFLIIDAGHGGKDPGAIGKGGIKEKWMTLKIAKSLEAYLKTRLKKVRIVLTRNSDKFIELAERTEIANKMLKKKENGIFVSVHINASILPSISGCETYFLSQNPSNDEARATAALENNVIVLENRSKRKTYKDVEHVEAIMLTTQIQKESRILANSIQNLMAKELYESSSKGVKNADFFVLRGSLMPAALVEVGYISNSKEARKLADTQYQKKIAKGIGEGIINFINEYNKNI